MCWCWCPRSIGVGQQAASEADLHPELPQMMWAGSELAVLRWSVEEQVLLREQVLMVSLCPGASGPGQRGAAGLV